jgi:Tfp pilus assembly protein PilZ
MDMRTAVITFGQPSEFGKVYLRDFPNGGLFIETDGDYFLGERLRILACFPEIPEGIEIHGTIVWRRSPAKRTSPLKPGIGVSLDETEKERLRFLLNYSNGEAEIRRGRSRRIPADFRVDFACSREWHSGKALNISREGLFILTDAPVSPNTTLQMKLYLSSGSPPEVFLGKVAWQCGRKPETGIGVEFQFGTQIRRQKILQYVEQGESTLAKRFPTDDHVKLRLGMTPS